MNARLFRQLRLLRIVPLLALAGSVAAQPAPHHAATRPQVQAEIQRLNLAFTADETACGERFAVTACVDDSRLRRRDALAPWRARLLALDDAERRERAAARLQAIETKQRAVAARPPVPELHAAPPRRPLLPAGTPAAVREDPSAARRQTNEDGAAQRAAAGERRRQRMQEEAERIRARQAERGNDKRSAPLPVPEVSR